MTLYLRPIEVEAIHKDQIARYGGGDGIRDYGLFEAALYRPQQGYYSSLLKEAAALWESLGQNHPFIDGNKRTAFAVTYTFLAINNIEITANADDIFDFIIKQYDAKAFTFANLEKWLINNTKQRN